MNSVEANVVLGLELFANFWKCVLHIIIPSKSTIDCMKLSFVSVSRVMLGFGVTAVQTQTSTRVQCFSGTNFGSFHAHILMGWIGGLYCSFLYYLCVSLIFLRFSLSFIDLWTTHFVVGRIVWINKPTIHLLGQCSSPCTKFVSYEIGIF